MIVLYNLFIRLYSGAIFLASLFGNEKANAWRRGRKDILQIIKQRLSTSEKDKKIWVHAASLGEFEQGRPIIELIKQRFPEYKIVLTFFSPSGYEVRKNYNGADYIFYLPADTASNAAAFLNIVNPSKVFFIKYEYWYHYLSMLKKRQVPVYLCSAIFRENQVFFKWYGGWYRNILSFFRHLFVQTEKSAQLLASIGVTNVTVTGDTRFDRVYAIASQARDIPEVKAFVKEQRCLIAGSTWEPDEELICRYINECTLSLKYIIASHEIHEAHIQGIEKLMKKKVVRFSTWKQNMSGDFDVLIIDNIGMLSSLYRYGQVAYIGGAFGKGLHNILEAATFGLPVLFGPNHTKFQEALDLIRMKGAFAINEYSQLKSKLDELFTKEIVLAEAGAQASALVKMNVGATEKILKTVFH